MNKKDNPYLGLPSSAFWRSAVVEKNPFQISDLWKPKFSINQKDKFITAGSCFAQHIGHSLKSNGFSWFDAEPTPIENANSKKYNYGIFSFRTGNIYSVALLKQWIKWSLSDCDSKEVWDFDGRYQDPFRPMIEPNGFSSQEEMFLSRRNTLSAIKNAITTANVFVFTLGLTETWLNNETGYVYPMAPGTMGGKYDSNIHEFKNYKFSEIKLDLKWVVENIILLNPKMKFLLTVSPVPLTATASGKHVLNASSYSKSVLRALAGDISDEFDCVDYFPSYEIITSSIYRGIFYLPNGRDISSQGVDHVMKQFFSAIEFNQEINIKNNTITNMIELNDVYCEDALLSTFGVFK